MDIWLIGSDISQNAIETTEKNVNFAELDEIYHNYNVIEAKERNLINNSMILQSHWPK